MSDLAGLVASGRSDVLPGVTLMPWTLREYGEAEAEVAREYLANAAASGSELVVDRALVSVQQGKLRYGTDAFRHWLFTPTSLPTMLFLSARNSVKKMGKADAMALLTEENSNAVHLGILDLLGYSQKKKAEQTSQTGQSTGSELSTSSENEDSDTKKSAA